MRNLVFILLIVLFSVPSIAQENQAVNEKIYQNDTVVWFGADFSLFRLSNGKKVGQDEKLINYVYGWNEYYKQIVSNVKMAKWLSAKKVFNDKGFTDIAYEQHLAKRWIINGKYEISQLEIEDHLSNYTSKHKGIGVVFIMECFFKGDPSKISGYFVWFDIESKKIMETFKVHGGATTFRHVKIILPQDNKMPKSKGMLIYWCNGMMESTVDFATQYKDRNPFKVEKQY